MSRLMTSFAAVLLCVSAAVAADADTQATSADRDFFTVDLGTLVAQFGQSNIVSEPAILQASFYQVDTTPHLKLGPGSEAYLLRPDRQQADFAGYRIIGRKPKGQPVEGSVFLLQRHPQQPQESVLARFDFEVAAVPSETATREDFLRAKGSEMTRLWSEQVSGAAVFRHHATQSLGELGEQAEASGPRWRNSRATDIDRTIRMSSGGRAVSENLRLDVQINLPEPGDATLVPISKVRGITVREIDWAPLMAEQDPETDPLARLIPHDQYVVLMPSFAALLQIIDRGDQLARPLVQWLEADSRRTDVLGFYQRQLGLPINTLTRQFGGAMIQEVAITGGDPYFRTGTDLAVLMRSQQPELLHQTITAMIASEAALHPTAQQIAHQFDGFHVIEWRSDDRTVSSCAVRIDDTVVVANSLQQLRAIVKRAEGAKQSLHDLDEYRFFRQRYQRSQSDEAALVVITDAAIRRWCGPQWRIAASRRTRARATIADMTVQHADALVRGQVQARTAIHPSETSPDAGTLMLTSRGVYSQDYGDLDFQTPIAEMELAYVTQEEAELYERWRRGYERQWSRVFDPIAVQVTMQENVLAADLSVIPLVLQTQYRFLQDLVGDMRLDPRAGDRHPEALAQMVVAVDPDSMILQFVRGSFRNDAGPFGDNITGWLDDAVSIYFDRDPAWIERLQSRDPWEWNSDDLARDLPIGFFLPSRNNLQLAGFVVALRGMLDQVSPNLIRWENRTHGDMTYVCGTVQQNSGLGDPDSLPDLYYVTTPAGLTFSANEGVIRRAIDRHTQAQSKAAADRDTDDVAADTDPTHPATLHKPQMTVDVSGQAIELASRHNYRSGLLQMHRLAFSNIPIMNYLRQRYPDRDPADVYFTLFGERLVEPGGGQYQWNEQYGSYVSSQYGFHLEPRVGPTIASALAPDDRLQTELSFQDGGLRARVSVQKAQQK